MFKRLLTPLIIVIFSGLLSTANAQNATPPIMQHSWASDFGLISFRDGLYDVEKTIDKLIRGELKRNNKTGVYTYEGQWGRHKSNNWYDLEFVFAPDGNSFQGKYLSTDGTWKQWNGKVVNLDSGALEPDLTVEWDSTRGPTRFTDGWIGKGDYRFNGGFENTDGSYYEYAGHWWPAETNNTKEFRIRFSRNGKSFEGWYIDLDGRQKSWTGRNPR